MKKISILLLCLCVFCTCAMAEQTSMQYYFTGQVSAGQEHPLKAPISGSISSLFTKQNLAVSQGSDVLEITPELASSPIDGVVGSIIAKVGDDMNSLKEIYKASMYLDRENQGIAVCTHIHAAKPYEYKVAVLGEKVYLQNRSDITQVGEGEVIARDDKGFTVKMTKGEIQYGSRIYVYRDEKMQAHTRLGGGRLKRENPVPVNADGFMMQLLVKSGDHVKAGDPLFVYTKRFALNYEGPILKMPADGIITKLDKKLSDKVEADEVVGTYILNNEKFVTAKVTELEANTLKLGNVLLGTALGTTKPIECTVSNIAAIPDDKGTYEVQLTTEGIANLRIGTTLSFSGGIVEKTKSK